MRRIGGSTLARQADKRPTRRVQFGHPSLDGSDTRVGELTRPDAVGRCVEFEQFVDFGECETRGLCRFDEAQTRVDGFVIAANSAPHAAIFTLPGNGKKAFALIETNGFDIDACPFRKLADGHVTQGLDSVLWYATYMGGS